MEITEKKEEQGLILSLHGRLDANAASQAEERLKAVVGRGEIKLALNLSDVDYISSAGLQVLLKLLKEIDSREGRLVLCHLSQYVREIFDLTGFSAIFTVLESCDEALDQL